MFKIAYLGLGPLCTAVAGNQVKSKASDSGPTQCPVTRGTSLQEIGAPIEIGEKVVESELLASYCETVCSI